MIAKTALALCSGFVLAGGIAVVWANNSTQISGHPRVIDGDTLAFGRTHVRLASIDAPESAQTCRMPWGTEPCGQDATRTLQGLIGERVVTCRRKDTDRYGRVVAWCATATLDLNREMVRRGMAVDYTRYSAGQYADEEADARAQRRGIWAGEFEMPWKWRREHR